MSKFALCYDNGLGLACRRLRKSEIKRVLGALDSNIVDIVHQRAFGGSSVRATRVDLVLQMRGEEQVDEVVHELEARGYECGRGG